MRTIGAHEARTLCGTLLSDVQSGETVIITRHGQPVARLVPIDQETDDAAAAMEAIHRYRREHRPTLGGYPSAIVLKRAVRSECLDDSTPGKLDENDRRI